MAGNSFGQAFRITSFGESHGPGVGVVIDGCPPGYDIDLLEIQAALDRRRPGQSHLATPRKESDTVTWLSGLSGGKTLGSPLALMVANENQIQEHYRDLEAAYRPSHADYTTDLKYGIRAPSGGGRASARETIARVAAAAVATQILRQLCPEFRVLAWVAEVKGVQAVIPDPTAVTSAMVEANPLRCPAENWQALEKVVVGAQGQGDSVGGVVYCRIIASPLGLGEPAFDKLEADLAKGMMSLPASKGFEIGSGFAGTHLYGSEHNDAFVPGGDRIRTVTNHSGGVQGGISNGEDIYFRVAFKPVATIFKEQDSVDTQGRAIKVRPKQGRHDPCVLPRAVPIVEAMAILTVMDHYLRQAVVVATRNSGVDHS